MDIHLLYAGIARSHGCCWATREDVVITKRGKPVASLVGRKPAKKRVDLDWLGSRTEDLPLQAEDSGTFMRRVRDADRY